MSNERMNYLQEKRIEVLNTIKPIMDAFSIKDYDYIVKDTGQTETLRINDTYIGCSCNSDYAIVNEVIKYLVIVRDIYLGAFNRQSRNTLREYWLTRERVVVEFWKDEFLLKDGQK